MHGVPPPFDKLLALLVVDLSASDDQMEVAGLRLYANVQAVAGLGVRRVRLKGFLVAGQSDPDADVLVAETEPCSHLRRTQPTAAFAQQALVVRGETRFHRK